MRFNRLLKKIIIKEFTDDEGVSPIVATLVLIVVAIVGAAAVALIMGSFSSNVSSQMSSSDSIVNESQMHPPKTDLYVFAAASLQTPFNEIKAEYETLHPTVNIVYNFDSSGTLQTQIDKGGAQCDVFASAATTQMTALSNEGYMNNSTINWDFAKNKLAIIVPSNNPHNIQSLSDLTTYLSTHNLNVVVGDPNSVPVGKYTTVNLFGNMNSSTDYAPPQALNIKKNIVSYASNVYQVVTQVALGQADVGFVYASDVPAEYKSRVYVIRIPDTDSAGKTINVLATYPIGALQTNKPNLAQDYINYVTGDPGEYILQKDYFLPP